MFLLYSNVFLSNAERFPSSTDAAALTDLMLLDDLLPEVIYVVQIVLTVLNVLTVAATLQTGRY